MRRILLASLWVLAAVFGTAPAVHACMCDELPSPCTAMAENRAIFVGTPTAIEPDPANDSTLIVSMNIGERFSGTLTGSRTTVRTSRGDVSCGYPFQIGVQYLVYADGSDDALGVSRCSRTGPLAARQDDVTLLNALSAGSAVTRLSGQLAVWFAVLDGGWASSRPAGPLPDIPITIEGQGVRRQTTTDRNGRFRVLGVPPGQYVVRATLPEPFVMSLDKPYTVTVDACTAELDMAATTVPLSGVLLQANGQPAPAHVKLRIALFDAAKGVDRERTTITFTEEGGRWNAEGLWPGRYIVGVNTFDAPDKDTPYPAVWLPSATRPSDARVFDVHPDRPQTVTLTLPAPLAPLSIRGYAIGPDEQRRAGARVSLIDDDAADGGASARTVDSVETDADGTFVLSGWRGRTYHVEAWQPAVIGMVGGPAAQRGYELRTVITERR
ncbi:MAG: carboxypeptidase regulatory-like domain-containing protein [Acidobacteria bacterium]|nr:carboxypeptidase regulatory-like domain-containing protein [Acidobacteriota bacterium]